MFWIQLGASFISCLIEFFLVFDFLLSVFDVKVSKQRMIMYFFVGVLSLTAINMLNFSGLNLLFSILLNFIMVSLVFESKLSVRIVYLIVIQIVITGSEAFMLVIAIITSLDLRRGGAAVLADNLFMLIFIRFIDFVIFMIVKQISKKSQSKMDNGLFWIYLLIPVLTIITMLSLLYTEFQNEVKMVSKNIITMFFTFLMLFTFLLLYAFQKHTEKISDLLTSQMEISQKNKEIERLSKISQYNDDYRESVHNMTHSLKVMEHLAREHRDDEIIEIIQSLIGIFHIEQIYQYCNNKLLNVILSEYKKRAESTGIAFQIYVEPGCIINNVEATDFAAVFGNLLDNAFEAVTNISEGTVDFKMFMHDGGEMCVVKIVNDFSHELKKKNGQLITSKTEQGFHGIGLKSVNHMMEKYQATFSYYTEENKFYAILLFPL